MVSSESVVSTATNDEPAGAISWEGPTYARSRSAAVGCLLAVLTAIVAVVALAVAAIVSSGSVSAEMLVVGGVLFLVGGPVSLLYVAIAYDESTDQQKQSLRRFVFSPFSDDLSWLRVEWVGGGVLAALGVGWWLSGTPFTVGTLAPLVAGLAPLLVMVGGSSYRVDPGDEMLEIELSYGDHTSERSLEWLVGVRRLRVGSVSLFVCSNRGKRWYEGVTFVVVPESVADSVAAVFRRAAETGPPRRINREDRIIFGVVGASMIGVGPLLYLLSGEAAMLFILGGFSTLIGLAAVLHAFRG